MHLFMMYMSVIYSCHVSSTESLLLRSEEPKDYKAALQKTTWVPGGHQQNTKQPCHVSFCQGRQATLWAAQGGVTAGEGR